MRRAKVLGLAVVPLGLLLAPDALADSASINPGFMISGVTGEEPYFALGGELSFMYFPTDEVITEQIGVGAFLQAQTYDTDFGRYAAGIQAGSALGGEIGWAFRERGPDSAPGHGLHLAGFLSAGLLVASLRSTIPLIGDDEPGRSAPGYELAFNLALKLPIPIGDFDAIGPLSHGRPLRCGDQHILPELLIDGVPTRASELRDTSAQQYAEDARAEHASVPAFLRLASELARHGARSLAQRALRAAHEEVSHARICLDIARSRSRTRLALGRISLPARPLPSLEALAVESALDGFVAEGRAAAEVRRQAERERDPVVRRALQRVARDERAHAELARDVVRHCVARSGPSARRAVTRALEAVSFSARALLD